MIKSNNHPWAIGVDIGGTKIEIAQVDSKGMIKSRKVIHTNVAGGPQVIVNDILKVIDQLTEEADETPRAVGVGIAGQVLAQTGVVKYAPNLSWKDVNLQTLLQKKVQIPLVVLNDTRAATWGEWMHGAGQLSKDMICLFIGTGIGGGIISNGQLMTGNTNSAGELGHVIVEINGPQCSCGSRGCLEALASGWALAKRAQAEIEADTTVGKTILSYANENVEKITAVHVIEAAKVGNPLAQEIVNDAIEAIVAGSISFVNAFNPEKLILGGGLGLAIPNLVERVYEGVCTNALKVATEHLQVLPAALHTDAGVIGAATYALHRV